jgi:hypothetical protein
MEIRWENGLGGSGGYERIFAPNARILSKKIKKIRWYPPDPPNPFSHSITCISFLIQINRIAAHPSQLYLEYIAYFHNIAITHF